jgi:GNAT superfamily N-acetyltransferase
MSVGAINIEVAQPHEIFSVLELLEELLMELADEGHDVPWVDREKLQTDIRRNLDSEAGSYGGPGRLMAILAKEEHGVAVGVLMLTQCFALYAGGEYGVIDETYVRPEYRGQDIERQLLDEAVAVAQRRGWLRLDVTGPEAGRGERTARFSRELGF